PTGADFLKLTHFPPYLARQAFHDRRLITADALQVFHKIILCPLVLRPGGNIAYDRLPALFWEVLCHVFLFPPEITMFIQQVIKFAHVIGAASTFTIAIKEALGAAKVM